MTTIKSLAADMDVSEADAAGFVACLSIWTSKGYSVEQAIEKHMAQLERLVIGIWEMTDEQKRAFVINTFFPEAQ